ncbi:predicted protein [Sclerotinia sclerotiorum 1980 UF-70]|uniref:Uncharacterized protein n=1 Tax=Sclerotinia sclerotiorum (strain ATCC 18683 / 1980 / Ss-1) TaxID=665079 RepID=A7EH46_SCLS1|nr:predicted protein [Sclerotinia sclerotiorum 1980 UF-70]EDO02162.1 predicted protein [Sclerotinia sclerotiorum 1980 UF-70]
MAFPEDFNIGGDRGGRLRFSVSVFEKRMLEGANSAHEKHGNDDQFRHDSITTIHSYAYQE